MQLGDSALPFFAAATKDDFYRDSVFPAVLETAWPGGTLRFDAAEVNLHGESSLLLPRKSFEVKMPYRVAPLGGGVALKKFFLIAMEQDTGYFRNALLLAYGEDVRRLGLMPLLYEGQELLDSLNAHLYLDQYLAWLAFNRLVRNGDYLDEVFYYRTPQDRRWHVMGWDYEDIFQPPHGGRFTEGSWVYNNEYPLDSAIEKTPLLLSFYGQALRAMAEELDSAILEAACARVRSEVLPWFADTAIARINANLGVAPAEAQAALERELYRRQAELLSTRDTLLRAP